MGTIAFCCTVSLDPLELLLFKQLSVSCVTRVVPDAFSGVIIVVENLAIARATWLPTSGQWLLERCSAQPSQVVVIR